MAVEKIYVKNMVCPRCIESVKNTLEQLVIPFQHVQLGEVTLTFALEEEKKKRLKEQLVEKGFDLLEDKKAKIVEKVKNLVLELIEHFEDQKLVKFSEYLSKNIGYDYSHISGIFSENQGITIERYLILQKIEHAKELLTYNELNLNEIADKLHYSSSAALSTQFKDVTGMTPTEFKKLREPGRKSLDAVG